MFSFFVYIFFCFHVISAEENYGIELTLIDFQPYRFQNGFMAEFQLNKDVNYSNFGLMRLGDKDTNDRLVTKLNQEYSMNSSQKKGTKFTILKDLNMRRMFYGTFFFQLETQDGNVYKSNQFTKNEHGHWIIKRSVGKMKNEPVKKTWFETYKYYLLGGVAALLFLLVISVIKAIKIYKSK